MAVLAASALWSGGILLSRHQPTATGGTAATPSPPGAAATPVPTQPPAGALGDLQMETRASGWARRLRDGAILHTNSGILLWSVASPPGTVLALAPIDAEAAVAVTAQTAGSGSSTIRSWATGDGGAIWSREGSFAVRDALLPAASLEFVDADHGWFSVESAGTGDALPILLFHTGDGGARWTRMAAKLAPSGAPATAGAGLPSCGVLTPTFTSPAMGWLTGSCESGPPPLAVTHDAGGTWEPVRLPAAVPSPVGNTSFPPHFTSPADGVLLTESEGADPVRASLFATTDGGRSWQLRSSMAGTPLADAFPAASLSWLVLDSAYGDSAASDLLLSGDGGRTWKRLDAFPYLGLGLDFLDASVGWAAPVYAPLEAATPYLLETDDGGRSWKALRPEVTPGSS
jgi:photosystem II stability/assembly factor-like uncharacterized protein